MSQDKHVHFVGIGGSGMSAIAKVMMEMGYRISGSDLNDQALLKQLRTQGVKIYIGHEAQNIQGADYVVYSSGIPKDNIELTSARNLDIPLLHRSQMLAQLLNQKYGIAITGAHGKTTTSSMITCMMMQANLDPTFLIGGEVLDFGYNAKAGQSDYVVAEADESDGSFLKYFPAIAVITNIEADHLENYNGNFEHLKAAYIQFIHQIKRKGSLIICLDDPIIAELVHRDDVQQIIKKRQIDVISYGIEAEGVTLTTKELQLKNRSSLFQAMHKRGIIGDFQLQVPGKHNVLNALACIAVALKLHVPIEHVQASLHSFIGAKRRFQVIGEAHNILIVDDYAHHPTEIMATIEAAKSSGRRILALFQPQRYTRTFYLLEAFSFAFAEADRVYITDIFSPSGEKPIEGVTSTELVQKIYENSNANVIYVPSQKELVNQLIQEAKSGDIVLTMGAGDIWKVAYNLHSYYTHLDQCSES